MIGRIVKHWLMKILFIFTSKIVSLSFRVGKNLLWKNIRVSGECGEPCLTYICATVATLGFAGSVLSALHSFPEFTGTFPTGVCLNVLSVIEIYLFVVGKLLRYSSDLEGARIMLLSTAADLKKIGADRRLDYICEYSWKLIIRVGFVVPLCIAHYVWQREEIQATKVELGFLALFFAFQLMQLCYWSVLSQLHDMTAIFEIYVFNSQNRLKKKWQSSVLCRILLMLKSTHEVTSFLHSNQRELAVTYNFLVFSTLTSYTVLNLGYDVASEYPFTCSCMFFQLVFILLTETDLKMMYDFNKSIHEKIRNIEEILASTRDQIRSIPLWRGEYQTLRSFLQMKYLSKCLAHSITMGAGAHVISFYLNSQPVSEHSIEEFESPAARIG